ncbi:carbohydrate kinase [Streptomyces sp. 3MP-14]|uniref:ATP:glycerol 3-phosphotransferase n=1 Tax=Streptomyces mimosae TaxID=2586635 RepID=A0A5N6ARW8_9ACTN|nr:MULTISPECIES: FGGY family carbohydrate kinase [Streptomyces]KAB8170915.1 carbohydrate kinase [Streptomyces mimosae]KAB8179734.1 carbohydrate kinase [Streptomyces sp. 3MP-14]
MSTVLAIDQGTSGTKAIVVAEDGTALAVAEEPVRPRYLDGGRVEQDPDELLDSVLTAGRRALAEAGRPVDAVALANQGETVLAWDPDSGEPLTDALVWQDRRAESVCAELADHAELVARRTGLVLDPYFSAPKMAWLRRHRTREGVVTTTDTWLVHRLTGAFVTDVTTASRSLLLDVDTLTWDGELLELFGLAGERLPRLVDCDEIVGTTEAFGGRLPVAGLVVDQQAALVAEGCLTPGSAKCTFGTGAFLLANTGTRAVRSRSGLTSSVAWRAGGETAYCVDGQVYTAASAIRWLTDSGLLSAPGELDAVAAPDAGGVLCVPALAGLAAPWWRPDATASLTGMTLATGRGQLVRAVLEGVAAQVAEVCRLVADDLGAPLSRLRADGGLTHSRALMQAQADLAQLPVDVYPSGHATPLGAAALARVALRPGLPLAEAVGDWRPSTVYEPAWSPDRAAAFRDRWRRAAELGLPGG